ncbi:MAG: glutamine--fructose-6-phosphate transaminase (isomerizing) [Clostridiales bacterium]|jgi:glucosamine--fructose-6-phosphate aminotransferase (isomerizing)|uniref:Glutamine--fructose-6-phosphate aminotransferase [isomerizing] n=1 Tax=Intestinimonas massiliensis (ex Afouda et al. 2020) TaxID=1673721 RepID=A0AAW5JIW9_9FIRM|nr:glutamine--fructose-6-phosphate transaminase (isomerizing) [Intestinimonas massiliensis (ex Afouda et al. 2020)]MCG4526231.1 glutamine--fructose-6-phosphate transaminase (isomerizing) [Intestinimonas massiliensis (ex Afouda et al. 2020)]MCQ4770111.1 glutamine--fructose-6-phosphate transaminase (isomerizing) [Intestinimonas massiliensis (ex Afouda et al. 2020)]MCQ4805954.1 glutamine--fructose-6-phosphate transaminase (isomerizing) [Intestinimonas massiliensis (ex Afouda et al. 2020)]MDU132420
MCGIVGFIGTEEAAPILLDGLARLEYRGYDSAGLAVYDQVEGLKVVKAKGRLQVLSDIVEGGKNIHGTVGLGHTRWATHGEPSDVNSHPQVSMSGRIAVVHNGIIENYVQIKEFLESKDVKFVSQTDTEVVAQLLEYYYRGDIMEALTKVLHRIEGAYALGIICADCPDRLIAARKDSPLILGYGEGCHFLASDVTAVIKYTREVCYLEDGEIAVLTADGITVYNHPYLQPVEKEKHHVDWEISAAEKGGYEHFMAKEIMEQPKAFRDTVFPRIQDGRVVLDDLNLDGEYLKNADKIYIIACGSSYHVGMVAKYVLEKLLRKPVEVTLASEFRYCDPLVSERTLCIVISQSGETIDTLAAMREAKRLGARILSIVNVVGSSIARESDDVLYTWAGPEIAVATTKAYSTQLAVIYLIALRFAELLGTIGEEEYENIVAEILTIPTKMERILENREAIQYYASIYFNHESIFFIGRNIDYAIGLEGSLKLKEISYIHSEAYAAGELKHGTISLIENGTLVVALASCVQLFDKLMSNVVEVKSRGADVVGLTVESKGSALKKTVDHAILVPDTHPMLLPSLDVIPMQLFAYYVALMRGCDIDKPRNLAKSVTVE